MGGVQWTGNRDWTDASFVASDGEEDLDDLDAAPYPPATQYEPHAPWSPAKVPDDRFAPDDLLASDVKPDPDRFAATAQLAADPYLADLSSAGPGAVGDQLAGESWLRALAPGARPSGEPPRAWAGEEWQGGPHWPGQPVNDTGPSRRWLMYAGVAVAAAIGGAAMLLHGSHPGNQAAGTMTRTVTPSASARAASQPAAPKTAPSKAATPLPSTAPSPAAVAAAPLSPTQAQGVLANYTAANNSANAARDDAQLATIETGSSDAIDVGQYRMQAAAGAAPYPAFAPVSSTYYLPASEPATGPRWFVVRVSNAFLSSPKKVSSAEYLLFTQATPGSPWKNAIEPYALSGANVPQPAIGADGLATAVTATTSALATSPGQLPALTAASLNGSGPVTDPGNLAESADQRFWQGKLPTATVTDTHALVTGDEGETFALRTTSGGALVFYTDAATLTITPPAGSALRLTIPGLYSAALSLPSAGLSYLDQFAAYDPPARGHAQHRRRLLGDHGEGVIRRPTASRRGRRRRGG